MLRLITSPEYEGRPEESFNRGVIQAFEERDIPFRVHKGQQTTKVKSSGICYDNYDFFHVHLDQLSDLIWSIEDQGEVLFFHDAWYPGLPIVATYCAMNELPVKLVGYVHGDPFFPGDFTSEWPWAKQEARSRYAIFDLILVATPYGRHVIDPHVSTPTKIKEVGFPISPLDPVPTPRKKRVVFPHRWHADKHPEVFLQLARDLPQYTFTLATPVPVKDVPEQIEVELCRTKERYHQVLASSKVVFSAADLETFGVAVVEGIQQGCIPLLPNRACYPYMYNKCYLYDDYPQARDMLISMLEKDKMSLPDLSPYYQSHRLIAEAVLELFKEF